MAIYGLFQTQILTIPFISLAQGLPIKTLESCSVDPEVPRSWRLKGLEIQSCYLLAVWPPTIPLNSESLNVLLYRMGLNLSRVVHASHFGAWSMRLLEECTQGRFQSCVPVNTAEVMGCNT